MKIGTLRGATGESKAKRDLQVNDELISVMWILGEIRSISKPKFISYDNSTDENSCLQSLLAPISVVIQLITIIIV